MVGLAFCSTRIRLSAVCSLCRLGYLVITWCCTVYDKCLDRWSGRVYDPFVVYSELECLGRPEIVFVEEKRIRRPEMAAK